MNALVGTVGWLWLAMASASPAFAARRPNILIVMADDCTASDLRPWGGTQARTPALERLAREGLVFERAYVSMAMCQPCRAELYTGLFPFRNGCAWNHSACRPEVRSLPHYLRNLGYRVGLAGKLHVAPASVFPFEHVPGYDDNCTRDPTRPHSLDGVRAFMTRAADQPFCLVVALVEPHVPWVMGDPSAYPPHQLRLPPYLADTPQTRADYSRYLAEITYMDSQLGELLELLDELRLSESTLVMFTSEQGAQFPGCKWTCWDAGLRTALVARWPGHVPAGGRTRALVQYVDVLPTLIELAGGNPAAIQPPLDGQSFAPVLRGERQRHRSYAYGIHNNIPEGPPFPIRTVTDGEWRYIRNLTPERLYIEKHMMGQLGGSAPHNRYWTSWLAESWNRPEVLRLIERYMKRPAEELYHTASDPYELENRAADPECTQIKARLAAELDRWLAEQGDPGGVMDSLEALAAAREAARSQSSAR